MKRVLRRTPEKIWHYVNGKRIDGPPSSVSGDLTGVSGDLTDVSGDLTNAWGDLTNVWGDLTGVHGYLSAVSGNLTNVHGDLAGVRGDLTGVRGDLTNVSGNMTGMSGDLDDADLSAADREAGVDVEVLTDDDDVIDQSLKYKSYSELLVAFRSGELDSTKYVLVFDNDNTQLSYRGDDMDDEAAYEHCKKLFRGGGEADLGPLADALGIPWEYA